MDNTSLFFTIFNLSKKSPILDTLMVFGAEYLIFLTFLLIIIFFLKGGTKEKKVALFLIIATTVELVLVKTIRLFFYEPRPFVTLPITPLVLHEANASFPSMHTTIMATIAFTYYFYKSKYTPLFLVFMLWVGFARIFVGVHYPLDILGGIITGFLSILLPWQFKKLLASQGDALRA